MNSSIPRPEYPRPQFVREEWLCLNGTWQFEVDAGNTGRERGLLEKPLADTINVPFCPESELSGIGNVDFLRSVWYRREVEVPAAWKGKRVLLHFQAVDYDATVWCNGEEVARHRGGASPFACELGDVGGQTVTLVVRARDLHDGPGPRGKQSDRYGNHGCHYTRTTGIWQTVWIEPVPTTSLGRPRITPDVANGAFHIEQPLAKPKGTFRYRATLLDGGQEVSHAECNVQDFSPRVTLTVPEAKRRLWSIDDPHLYDLTLELLDANGTVLDSARSYAGLRSVTIDGKSVKLNGQTVFQRLVLDQGYYPDGILTAPSDEALVRDIDLSMEAGFNGARLHQKVFEERFLYHADRMGYLCWGEFPDWGCNAFGAPPERPHPGPTYITQWLECLERDYNHPSIVGWCPMNEQWQKRPDVVTDLDDVMRGMLLATKAFDTTRPVLDVSGWAHRVPESDIYDCHDYEQDPEQFAKHQADLADEKPLVNRIHDEDGSIAYAGQPYFVSEFGGIWWNPDVAESQDSWGYGTRPKTEKEFLDRFAGLCAVLLDDPKMFGYCYTQLTDVHQEQNGVYHFDRRPKVDDAGMQRIRKAQVRPAAIEQTDS